MKIHTPVHIVNVESGEGSFAYPFVLQRKTDPNRVHLCYSFENATLQTTAYAELEFY